MAQSDANICNLALRRVGVSGTIDNLEDDTAEARACRDVFAQSRASLLATVPWPFAQRRASLALIGSVEDVLLLRPTWAFAYALPGDCLVARDIYSGLRNQRADQRITYAIEHSATYGRILLTDLEAVADAPVELAYTAEITNPTLLPPLFVDALAWLLASELAMALAVKEPLERRARQGYELALSRAAAVALNEGVADAAPESELISVRG